MLLLLHGCASSYPGAGHREALPQANKAASFIPIPEIEPRVTYRLKQADDVWQKLILGFELQQHYQQQRVTETRKKLERNPHYLTHLKPGIEHYLGYIARRVAVRRLPLELAVMPIVESGLDPYAFSPGAAAGLWQFVPGTARDYGLKIDWWVDERRDPVASTDAALSYLIDLHKQFGDWLLAIAAYNCGAGNVRKAIRKSGSRDFWRLDLPRETSVYVPRIIALSAIIADRKQHTMLLPELGSSDYFEQVQLPGQTEIAQVSKRTGLSVESLYALNPALNRWATHPEGPHRVLVPSSEKTRVQQQVAQMSADERLNWVRYQIQPGDSLSTIAQRFHTSLAAIKSSNNLNGHLIRSGDSLMIASNPNASEGFNADNPLLTSRGSAVPYRVRPGDSLWSIGTEFGISVTRLARYNRLDSQATLRAGSTLQVPQQNGLKKVIYRVRKGDSLSAIATKFKLSIADILSWNGLKKSKYLQPGQKLVLLVSLLQA